MAYVPVGGGQAGPMTGGRVLQVMSGELPSGEPRTRLRVHEPPLQELAEHEWSFEGLAAVERPSGEFGSDIVGLMQDGRLVRIDLSRGELSLMPYRLDIDDPYNPFLID